MPNFAANLPVDAQGYVDITPALKKQEQNKAAEASAKLADRMLALSFGMQMVLSTIEGFGFKPESTAGRAGLGAATGAAQGAGWAASRTQGGNGGSCYGRSRWGGSCS